MRRRAAFLALAAALGAAGCGGDDDGQKAEKAKGLPRPSNAVPIGATADALRDFANSAAFPIYWVGTRSGHVYEYSRSREGNVFIRYLPPGVPIGDRKADYLSVGTYPHKDPVGLLRKSAARPGAVERQAPRGGIAVSSNRRSPSTYLAYPGNDVLIEVYDPSPQRARRAAVSRRLRPVR